MGWTKNIYIFVDSHNNGLQTSDRIKWGPTINKASRKMSTTFPSVSFHCKSLLSSAKSMGPIYSCQTKCTFPQQIGFFYLHKWSLNVIWSSKGVIYWHYGWHNNYPIISILGCNTIIQPLGYLEMQGSKILNNSLIIIYHNRTASIRCNVHTWTHVSYHH